MRIAIVTCAAYPDLSPSDALYRAALERLGAVVEIVPWNGEPLATRAALLQADAAVLRSPWDYPQQLPAFLRWLAACADIRLLNPPALVRWNADKRYLLDLAQAGVPIPPLGVLPADADAEDLRAALASLETDLAVLKPVWGGSGRGVGLVSPKTLDEALRHTRREAPECPLIVQAFAPEIVETGEISLTFIGGAFAHAVRKRPADGDFRVNTRYAPRAPERIAPSVRVRTGAEAVLRALPTDAPPLYARIDGLESSEGFLCLEAEVIDPALFFPLAPESADHMARATFAAIRH